MLKDQVLERLRSKEAMIAIIGLGYVGIPLVLRFAEQGYKVVGFDIDAPKVSTLNAGHSLIEHIPDAHVQAAIAGGFEATSDMARVAEADAIILCVPTPLTKQREPNLEFVINTVEAIAPYVRPGQVVSLESTTYPGTTEEELRPRLEKAGLIIGETGFLVYSPEREDPGNAQFSTRSIPKIVGGSTPACLEAGLALYGGVIERVVPVSSTQAAELTKLLENIHRAVNIGLVNEMKVVADRMGIDIHEVINAAATKPFGFVPYYPGPGLGGHCIPIDPFYLTWKAREFGVHTRFIELAGEVNNAMPDYVINKLVMALNDRGKAVKGCRILILGIAYKRDVDDMRESPSVVIMEKLEALGAQVSYSDPHIPTFPKMREHHFELDSVALDERTIGSCDCVLLATDHGAFDYDLIGRHAQLIVDTRGKFDRSDPKVIAA
jgi:UDP-N-acetyl-D-glucosamine dehydrogenase